MPFFVQRSGWTGTGERPASFTATSQGACACDSRGADPSEGRWLAAAQGRHAPLAAHAEAKPLTPRGVLTGKPSAATEQAAQGRHAPLAAHAAAKPSTNAPLRPRGILGGEG